MRKFRFFSLLVHKNLIQYDHSVDLTNRGEISCRAIWGSLCTGVSEILTSWVKNILKIPTLFCSYKELHIHFTVPTCLLLSDFIFTSWILSNCKQLSTCLCTQHFYLSQSYWSTTEITVPELKSLSRKNDIAKLFKTNCSKNTFAISEILWSFG